MENRRTRILSLDEQRRLLAVCHLKLQAILAMALITAARIGELLTLRWDQCDAREIVFLKTKNGKARRLPLSPTLAQILREQPHLTDYVFVNPRTQRPYTTIMASFRRALARAQIDDADIALHTLRHTALSQMIEAGYDDYTVMEISGHSSTRILARYTHPTADRKIAALEVAAVVTKWSHRTDRADPGDSDPADEIPVSSDLARVVNGGALNTNIHFHTLAIDGFFSKDGDAVRFHPSPALDAADVDEVLATVEAYVHRLLAGRGADDGDDGGNTVDEWANEAPALAGLAAASVQGRIALGPRAGARVRRCGDSLAVATDPPGLGPCHARHNGFDLHAGLCVPANQRDRLERIARYALRPPVSQERLQWTDDGQVRLELRRPWADGTTHLLFDPVELLERLAALTPRPRINLILYHGVLGPRAAWRSVVVQFGTTDGPSAGAESAPANEAHPETADRRPGRNYLWAELMRRSMGLDVLACPRCGGLLRLIAVIDDPAVVERVLRPGASDRDSRGPAGARAAG